MELAAKAGARSSARSARSVVLGLVSADEQRARFQIHLLHELVLQDRTGLG